MQKPFTLAAVVAIAVSIACGKSESERAAEQAAAELQKAAEAATQASDGSGQNVAKGMEEFAKAMAGMAGAMANGKTVEPVSFQALQSTFPELAGWEMEEPRGERMTSPVPFSQSQTTYTKGDSRIEVKVVDSGFAPLLIAPWSMMLAAGYSRESSDGYEKAVSVGGQPAFEKWNSETSDGELNILVDKRFLVTIEGSELADTKVLHELAGHMAFGRFADLK